MEIPECNQEWDEFHLIGVAVKMRPQFDRLSEEKPQEESRKHCEWGECHLIGGCG
jgi:hypothetical protein